MLHEDPLPDMGGSGGHVQDGGGRHRRVSPRLRAIQGDALDPRVGEHDGQGLARRLCPQVDGDEPFHWVSEDGSDAIAEMEFFGGNRLRCPEGDTTMRLDDEEDAGPYYCPRHNLELEKVERPHVRSHEGMVIVVDEDDR